MLSGSAPAVSVPRGINILRRHKCRQSSGTPNCYGRLSLPSTWAGYPVSIAYTRTIKRYTARTVSLKVYSVNGWGFSNLS